MRFLQEIFAHEEKLQKSCSFEEFEFLRGIEPEGPSAGSPMGTCVVFNVSRNQSSLWRACSRGVQTSGADDNSTERERLRARFDPIQSRG